MTRGQQRALLQLWPSMGIEYQGAVPPFDAIFGRSAPLILEIGFGMGLTLVQMAQNAPGENFIGVELYRPGVGACLAAAHLAGIDNLRIISHDCVEVLEEMIGDATLTKVQIFFPDPWPKKRHHKRRLLQPAFSALLQRKLAVGGLLHLATDWQPYAEQMVAVLQATPGLCNLASETDYVARPEWRPLTKFEQRGQGLGHGVWDIMFTNTPERSIY